MTRLSACSPRAAARSVTPPTAIGDHCHVGAGAVVAKGVTVGDHSVIGACAFVNRDVPPYTVAAGVPARPIGRVRVDADGGVNLDYD